MRVPAQHLLALALAGCLAAAQGFSWKQCGEGGFAVKDVALTPEPVQPGSTAVFKISADAGALRGAAVGAEQPPAGRSNAEALHQHRRAGLTPAPLPSCASQAWRCSRARSTCS